MPSHNASKRGGRPADDLYPEQRIPFAERPDRFPQDGDLRPGFAPFAHGDGEGMRRAHHDALEHRLSTYIYGFRQVRTSNGRYRMLDS
jgi:hypothetical protein